MSFRKYSGSLEQYVAKLKANAPFKHYLENVLKHGDILPRGKFFKGKTAGKPILVLDEFWMAAKSDVNVNSHFTWNREYLIKEAQKLDGKLCKDLDRQEQSILQLMVDQGRKYGIELRIAQQEGPASDIRDLVNYTALQWDDYLREKQAPIQVIVNEKGHFTTDKDFVAFGSTGLGRDREHDS
ncbi:hypothetical protein [Acinetobacter nosocomialis]|uniref:hypothetical protein n=1 Tax=Acinetobacter nosocomialis TaxID=106654 RepID=UPI001F16D828|nr:hypothetical protein [Acinetobacter nosocomialis]MCE7534209.1 hypothetical protein [Acinetobacter nosocomialis]